MVWKETQRQLVERLQRELRSRWGRIAEIEAALGLSDGYLNKMLSGQRGFRLDIFLQAIDLLGLDSRTFFTQALDICPQSDDFLAQLELLGDRDSAWLKIERATANLVAEDFPAVDLESLDLGSLAPFTTDLGADPRPAPNRIMADAAEVEEFAELPYREQDRRLRHTQKYRSLPFARAYLEHLDSLRYDHALVAAKRVTVVLTDLIPALPGSAKERLTLHCHALGIFGSARRHKGEFTSAAQAFRKALMLTRRAKMREETANLLLRASYLLKDFGQPERALVLLSEALVTFTRLGSRQDMGRALVDHGMMHCYAGDYEGAILDLEQALSYLAGTGETLRRNHLAAYQNLAYAYEQLGDLEAAEHCLANGAKQFGSKHEVDRARLQWSQGMVAFQRASYPRAEQLLRSAQGVFAGREGTLQIAVVTLDLLAALLAQGKHEEAAELASGMAQLVARVRNNRLAEAALVELVRATVAGKLSQQIVSEVKARLEAANASAVVRRKRLN